MRYEYSNVSLSEQLPSVSLVCMPPTCANVVGPSVGVGGWGWIAGGTAAEAGGHAHTF